jgi:hypothetical protein
VWDYVEIKETLLADGAVIFWNNGMNDVDWNDLHHRWLDILSESRYVFKIDKEDLIDGSN